MNLLKFIQNYFFNNIEKVAYESLPPIKDNRALPTCIDDFKECHFKLLRRLDKHPVKEPFSGIITIEIDIPNFIPILQNLNLVVVAPYVDSLYFTKNENLKTILKKLGLKISGNKDELIDRILKNTFAEQVRALAEYSDCYALTPLGWQTVNESYDRFKQLNQEFFKACVDMIMNLELPQTYRKICKRNAEMPIPPGLGCDWKKRYYDGLDKSLLVVYTDYYKNASDKLIAASSIYANMSGDSLRSVCLHLINIYNVEIEVTESVNSYSTKLSELQNKYFTTDSY